MHLLRPNSVCRERKMFSYTIGNLRVPCFPSFIIIIFFIIAVIEARCQKAQLSDLIHFRF